MIDDGWSEELLASLLEPPIMEVEREAVVQAISAVLGVGVFVVMMLLIGIRYENEGLPSEGALALVGALVGFILIMSVIGVWLARTGD